MKISKSPLYFLILGFLLFFTGCNLIAGEENKNDWPQEKSLSIKIEGMKEEIDVKLFRDEGLGVKTYYPAHMKAISGEKGVWFYYLWNGEINEEAYVKFSWMEKGKDETQEKLVSDPEFLFLQAGWEFKEQLVNTAGWVEKTLVFSNQKLARAALVELGKLGEREFMFVTQYGYEYGDGIYPRAGLIKENFFLLEEGEYLLEKLIIGQE